jgi:hypothetical protein
MLHRAGPIGVEFTSFEPMLDLGVPNGMALFIIQICDYILRARWGIRLFQITSGNTIGWH